MGRLYLGCALKEQAWAGWKRSDFRGAEFVQRPGEFKPAFSSGPCFAVLAGFSQVFSSQPLPDLYLYPVSYSTPSSSLTWPHHAFGISHHHSANNVSLLLAKNHTLNCFSSLQGLKGTSNINGPQTEWLFQAHVSMPGTSSQLAARP